MNKVVGMTVETPEQLSKALRMSQNCCMENTNIFVYNKDHRFADPNQLANNVRSQIRDIFGCFGGSFANGQIQGCYHIKTAHDRLERYCKTYITAKYHCSEAEMNSLECVAAEIAEELNKNTILKNDACTKVWAFLQWAKEYFKYEDHQDERDYSALELLKTQHGVCQAIAAMAVLILSKMGVKTLYVLGEGRDKDAWGTHAWNAVQLWGRWVHIDFTFALNSICLPSTRSSLGEAMFKKSHRWDPEKYSVQELNAKWDSIHPPEGRRVHLIINDKKCVIDGIGVRFEKPVLILREGKVQVALYGLLRILGGGAEYIAASNQVIICINGRRIIIENGASFINNGYFEIEIINKIGDAFWRNESTLEIVI